jgi:hypothetical protein
MTIRSGIGIGDHLRSAGLCDDKQPQPHVDPLQEPTVAFVRYDNLDRRESFNPDSCGTQYLGRVCTGANHD